MAGDNLRDYFVGAAVVAGIRCPGLVCYRLNSCCNPNLAVEFYGLGNEPIVAALEPAGEFEQLPVPGFRSSV